MSRMFSGSGVWSGCSGCGVGEGGCAAESRGVVSPCRPSSVASESGIVGGVFVASGSIFVGAGLSCLAFVVFAFDGSLF